MGVHFGSRGFGYKLATHFIHAGSGKDGMHMDLVLIKADSDFGQRYIARMRFAGRYAYAGHNCVCARVTQLLVTRMLEESAQSSQLRLA